MSEINRTFFFQIYRLPFFVPEVLFQNPNLQTPIPFFFANRFPSELFPAPIYPSSTMISLRFSLIFLPSLLIDLDKAIDVFTLAKQ